MSEKNKTKLKSFAILLLIIPIRLKTGKVLHFCSRKILGGRFTKCEQNVNMSITLILNFKKKRQEGQA